MAGPNSLASGLPSMLPRDLRARVFALLGVADLMAFRATCTRARDAGDEIFAEVVGALQVRHLGARQQAFLEARRPRLSSAAIFGFEPEALRRFAAAFGPGLRELRVEAPLAASDLAGLCPRLSRVETATLDVDRSAGRLPALPSAKYVRVNVDDRGPPPGRDVVDVLDLSLLLASPMRGLSVFVAASRVSVRIGNRLPSGAATLRSLEIVDTASNAHIDALEAFGNVETLLLRTLTFTPSARTFVLPRLREAELLWCEAAVAALRRMPELEHLVLVHRPLPGDVLLPQEPADVNLAALTALRRLETFLMIAETPVILCETLADFTDFARDRAVYVDGRTHVRVYSSQGSSLTLFCDGVVSL